MNQFTKRLLVFSFFVVGFASITLALSQSVRFKPWGVPDSRRDDYDKRLSEIDRHDALVKKYSQKARPIAKATPAFRDFGWVSPSESLQHVVLIENVGDADLNLKVRGSSSDRVSGSIENEALKPGEATRCTINLIAKSEPSQTSETQTVTITTNDPLQSTLTFSVQSQLREEVLLPKKIGLGKHDIGESATADFLVYSQLGEDLEIAGIENDSFDIEWVSIPVPNDTAELQAKSARSAQRVTVNVTAKDYGRYNDKFDVRVRLDGVEKHFDVEFGGSVRPPIGFYGPNVDQRNGINFGTVESGKQHDLFVVVRSRADRSRHIEILDIEPKELQAELQPLETAGSYRLRVSIPKDCPYRRFNLAEQHGYIKIGDPESKPYSSWLPVYGVVGNFKAD